MLKFNTDNSSFDSIGKSSLRESNILERYDLQKAIVSSWEEFKNELGFPSAFLIGQEITPDNSTQNNLDLLAYDADDSSLIVIELKRDKNKLQLLQAISYAAMVAKWDKETIVRHIKQQKFADYEELLGIVDSNELNPDIKIILIAEGFDPEVIVTADWLTTFSLNIYAYAIELHQLFDEKFLTIDQRYPLKELSDVYESRKTSRSSKNIKKDITWEEVISACEYEFASRAINMCREMKPGDPSRKRFIQIAEKFQGFQNLTFFFRNKYVNVYLLGGNNDLFEELLSKLSGDPKHGTWRDGFSLIIEKETQFMELVGLDARFKYD